MGENASEYTRRIAEHPLAARKHPRYCVTAGMTEAGQAKSFEAKTPIKLYNALVEAIGLDLSDITPAKVI